MRSNYERFGNLASALLSLALINPVGCTDSGETTERVVGKRAVAEVDSGAPTESATGCVDTMCEEAKLDDRWLCPVDTMSVRTDTVRYSVRVVDFVNRMPRANVEAKACRNNDLSCAQPVATFVDSGETGQVQLDLPTGFVGFLELKSDALDTLLYITNPIVRNTIDRDLTVPTRETIDLLATLLEYTWDMEKGLVVLEVLDCTEIPQAGIHFACREGGDPFYMVDGIPFKTEKMTMYDATNGTAEGGFINVPPGVVQFSAQVGTGDEAMKLGTLNVQIRPRTLTIIELHP